MVAVPAETAVTIPLAAFTDTVSGRSLTHAALEAGRIVPWASRTSTVSCPVSPTAVSVRSPGTMLSEVAVPGGGPEGPSPHPKSRTIPVSS